MCCCNRRARQVKRQLHGRIDTLREEFLQPRDDERVLVDNEYIEMNVRREEAGYPPSPIVGRRSRRRRANSIPPLRRVHFEDHFEDPRDEVLPARED